MTGEIFLTTERLTLRTFTADDVDLLVDLDSDPEVMAFVTGGRPTSREEIATETLPAFLGYYERFAGYGFWAAFVSDPAEFIGWFHLRAAPGHPPDEPELGYRLKRSGWGNGYAAEGSRALIDSAFARSGAARVLAETMTVHTGSRRVMEKAGMTLTRTFFQDWPDHIPGAEHGTVEYAISREEWEARR